jgi:uncharacterized iron-regulated protein
MKTIIKKIPSLCLAAGLLMGVFCQNVAAQIIDTKNGESITAQSLAELARDADIVLLGELHDNALHHRERAQLITQLAHPDLTIVAEHLPANSRPDFSGPTLAGLEAAGFDQQAWGWPLHLPLFDAIRHAGLAVVGGNLPKGLSREIVKNRQQAMPDKTREIHREAPLSAQAAKKLEQDLIDGHCGQLPQRYLEPMQLAQRATDISMALSLMENRPSVLVAGNGHVRKDYGVPQVLAAMAPSLKVISVGFYEGALARQEALPAFATQYDFVWFTEATSRTDPCENFKMR